MTITFCKTRWQDQGYDSYRDFFALAELSGFPIIYVDEIPARGAKGNVYIVTPQNGEWQHGIDTDARVIHWILEWDEYPPVPGVSEVWHFDEWFADCIGARYVPLGGHAGLAPNTEFLRDQYDVAYIAYMIPRRAAIRVDLMMRQLRMSPTGAWHEERDAILRSCKVYLHVHQREDRRGIPGLRMALAAAYKLPVISECVEQLGIFQDGDFLKCRYDEMPDFVFEWVQPEKADHLRGYGEALHQRLCVENTFRRVVEGAVA